MLNKIERNIVQNQEHLRDLNQVLMDCLEVLGIAEPPVPGVDPKTAPVGRLLVIAESAEMTSDMIMELMSKARILRDALTVDPTGDVAMEDVPVGAGRMYGSAEKSALSL